MTSYEQFFKDKRVTVMGLGLLGRGVGDVAFLAQQGAKVLVTDKKTTAELKESVERLKKYPNVSFVLGGHRESDFIDTDMVIKAAGVRLDSPEIVAARAAHVPVYMSTALFAKFAAGIGAKIVGVTGTRGKSSVSYMIHHALIEAGRKSYLGGNIRGVSTLAMLPEIKNEDVVVLELDSWQLQGFGDLSISPHVSVFTNLMMDHLNYYPDTDTYFSDKANIFKYQKEGDCFVVGTQVAQRIHGVRPPVTPITPVPLREDWQLKILGEHNRENAALAACALHALGLSETEVREGLESFAGVEGRLQFVREVNGVKIYNDNNATTPEATIAALQALDTGEKNIILIMGGADKGLDMSELVDEVNKSCKAVVFLAGTGTESFLKAESLKLKATHSGPFDSLDQTLRQALKLAKQGDTVLFSPAFASFGMFKNEYDRNDQFLRVVDAL